MSSIKPRYCKKNRANQEYLISVDDRAIPRFAQIEGALIEVSLYIHLGMYLNHVDDKGKLRSNITLFLFSILIFTKLRTL